jgi:hypothetical protein
METGDTLIRRQIAVGTKDTREFFTLHEFPSGRFLEGPFDQESVAREQGLKRVSDGDVWLETTAGSNILQLISA